ncbi:MULTISPECIES: preprotein translocase subunit SecA [Hyphomonas]|mgnify:CR=1 FL=1|uniref:Protein translocase subunit SecA n=1 Tax=Hyphomonas adhaerens TaxID=81029 RepID=A0A3B9H076_9PROT|nr:MULTISPECIES: preprotein translocase subunit SecA [Hyphomonas]MBB41137.1 preprotein translocase subunit SecA [Hyphomonas sp.]HAE28091.1 preprotein translocase subunit SecA [Hyphomonas adhaerens]|tara:strand:- start:284 stop:3067 length:2784 start_codon:yes stop_codon:yes gene_type:complete
MFSVARKIFGSANDRKLKPLRARVNRINALEPMMEALSDSALKGKTAEFRKRLADGATLDSLLEEAFAVTREAARRATGMRHFDVQLMGGMILHSGAIAEMRTGEGKTLVATLAAYLNALEGKGVHVVTVNDYLAKRDAEWMGQIYGFLGMTTGIIVHGITDEERKAAYASDITYGTNNEFGFDYLRDNMKYSLDQMAQRGHHFAIVDEVDSILIDEARTPLIISGPTDDRSDLYIKIDAMIPRLEEDDYELDEKQRSVTYAEGGMEKIETWLEEEGLLEGSLWEPHNITLVHHANQALRAHKLYARDKDYIVKGGEVMLIDEFTGRMMEGRRLSEGLHQAIEAKERTDIKPENQTLASITFQNYFRLYDKLSGMTGTALTEADEFADIYKLEVIDLPTNKPIQRIDEDDVVYRTAKAKYAEIVKEVRECHAKGQPILLGTASIEKSEILDNLLTAAKIPHKVLNARHHEQEALIVADAGVPGAVTVATNMAGRGTDIQLGGNFDLRFEQEKDKKEAELGRELTEGEASLLTSQIKADIEVKKKRALDAGGLYVLGTERHESRRIDNQLRGRTGRQGDPGKSKFYISIEDDLMRIFAAERMDAVMRRLGIKEDEGITHPWMNKAMETSQRKIEQRNFEIRKNVLKYDDVINDQRKAIFEQRMEFMRAEDVSDVIVEMREHVIDALVARTMPEKAYAEQWDVAGLREALRNEFAIDLPVDEWAAEEGVANKEVVQRIRDAVDKVYEAITTTVGADQMHRIEKQILLQVLDMRWREHLQLIDQLRSVIHLRSYGQRDPLNEFKSEAFNLFHNLLEELRATVTRSLMHVRVQQAPPEQAQQRPAPAQMPQRPAPAQMPAPQPPQVPAHETHLDPDTGVNEMDPADTSRPPGPELQQAEDDWSNTPRNSPCPCGSGKKYKHCHGALSTQRA